MTAKLAGLSGEIKDLEKRLVHLRAALDSPDMTIGLFDPTLAPKTIRPRPKRAVSMGQCKSSKLSRVGLGALRVARKPLTVREVAALVADQTGLDRSTLAAEKVVVASVRTTLARPSRWADV